MRASFLQLGLLICFVSLFLSNNGCSAAASKTVDATANPASGEASSAAKTSRGPTIEIKPNSPADTVRAFYTHLREKRFRQAIFLTNLRPAVEGLTDAELKEFQVDFESIAKYVPREIEINGEIISGNSATVTAKLPNADLDKEEIQELRLRKKGDVWVILTVDESAEKKIRQEGKNYFRALRIETHQDDAREMLDRVAKAQMAFAALNQGLYGDMDALINAEFLPPDIRTSESTGYNYAISVSSDRKEYSASAVPAVYGKTGRLSFAVKLDENSQPRLTSRDEGATKTK
ncbi:MAG: hypothetical protein ABI857_10275 [Acidobacteriota bacterium]